MEAGLLGAFMVSACIFGILYGHPGSTVRQTIPSTFIRGLLGGLSMGATALCIFYSPWGKQSRGAHQSIGDAGILRLGKVRMLTALQLYLWDKGHLRWSLLE